jgi:hypothetical protein
MVSALVLRVLPRPVGSQALVEALLELLRPERALAAAAWVPPEWTSRVVPMVSMLCPRA